MKGMADTGATGVVGQPRADVRARRRAIFRSTFLLALCTVVLFACILMYGDVRRRQRTVEEARWYADVLAKRVAETGTLPLNLELPADHPLPPGSFEWLSRRDAQLLRKSQGRIIAVYSTPVPRVFAPDGRAVVVFADGRFDVEWMALKAFDRSYTAQREEIQRRGAELHAPDARRP